MRFFAILLLPVSLAAQNPGPPRQMPERWVPLDSLVAQLAVTPEQRDILAPLHGTIDSLMAEGVRIRAAAREARERGRDRQAMMVFMERLTDLQRRLDHAFERFQHPLSDEQRATLRAVRPPRAAPPRQRP